MVLLILYAIFLIKLNIKKGGSNTPYQLQIKKQVRYRLFFTFSEGFVVNYFLIQI